MSDLKETTGTQAGLQVPLTQFPDLTQLLGAQPDIQTLSVVTHGNTLEWPHKFKMAMREVCRDRSLPNPVPSRLRAAAVPSRGILLLWPCSAEDRNGFLVRLSPAGRRITTDLTAAFSALQICLPYEIAVAIPATRYLHPVYGECLALHFQEAEFLPERSRTAAGLIEE